MVRAGIVVALGSALIVGACDHAGPPRVSPTQGAFGGGDALRIEGSGFAGHGPVTIYLCQRSAKGVVIEGDRLIRAMTPRADAAGLCALRLEFGDGHRVEVGGAFTYAEETAADAPSSFDMLATPAE